MISKTITEYLKRDGKRFFACDNISEYIADDVRKALIIELSIKFDEILRGLIIDIDNDPNSKETGERLARMYVDELMYGRFYPQPNATSFPNEGEEAYTGMLVVRAELKSMCSHHHQIVQGVGYIGIIPNGKVIGLSKYIRLAQHCARRGTLQEGLCNLITETIKTATGSNHVGVYLELEHGCCTNRGIMAHSSLTQTTVLSGDFKQADVKKEFFDNIQLQRLNSPK